MGIAKTIPKGIIVFLQLFKSDDDLLLKKSAINKIKENFNNSAGWKEKPKISTQRLAEAEPLGTKLGTKTNPNNNTLKI